MLMMVTVNEDLLVIQAGVFCFNFLKTFRM